MRLALKTASYGTVHVGVATTLAYALSGDLTVALGIGLLEPAVQTGVFAVHEKLWERRELPSREDRSPHGGRSNPRPRWPARPFAA